MLEWSGELELELEKLEGSEGELGELGEPVGGLGKLELGELGEPVGELGKLELGKLGELEWPEELRKFERPEGPEERVLVYLAP